MASQLVVLPTIYSAFAKLSATKVCFLLNQAIIVDPKLNQHVEVLFLFVVLLAQSES
jgi:hypothetical protein